jgi:hypothetical protein
MMQQIAAKSIASKRSVSGLSVVIALLALPATSVGSKPEIHRCIQDDGTVAFQEMPCPEPKETIDADSQIDRDDPPPADEFFDFVNPYDEPERPPTPTEAPPPAAVSQNRAECEKTTRDAIDAIDLELQKNGGKGAGREYLARLLELTEQLRNCKRL